MKDILAIFRAGFVRRWHTNPDLAHTVDRIDGHSARVARIILATHPNPSLDLIWAALTHDDGEIETGDMCCVTKDRYPMIARTLEELEHIARADLWGSDPCDDITAEDRKWLKFADRLDAYMWAAHHAPHVLSGDGWPEERKWLRGEAERIGAEAGMDALVDMEARHATP